ncbi:hypothetical protein QYM36_016560 [Artemia franciscana]|uniref:Uncharacterized protein n=1 Tax=Artemia franciscana TaxID=6661 RepID=A0AA88HFL3_ARTSF|nr:hypothetical protein QYM36_016560 [Artemia franciscana]
MPQERPQRRVNLFPSPSGSNSPSTPKYCENVDRRQPKTPSGFVLGDFVSLDVKKRLSSCDKKRRINPTSVELSEPKFGTVVRDLESSSAFKNAVERVDDNLSEIREGLKSERERIREKAWLKPFPEKLTTESNKIQPSLDLVTQKEELVQIADKYLNYVNSELLNFGSEFNFLFHLLTSTNGTRMKHFVINPELLYSAHNCCFLAVTILNSLRNFLSCLNGTTLKLLLRTGLIETMNLELANFLSELHQRKLAPSRVTLLQENVPFSIDNDIISCYANQVDFQAFKKQRDLFYEVYRVWKEDHMKDDWDFGQVLGSRIRGALNRRNGPINGSRFARLFCNQLISSCRNGGSFYGDSSQGDDAELLNLANSTSIAKIRKLQVGVTFSSLLPSFPLTVKRFKIRM